MKGLFFTSMILLIFLLLDISGCITDNSESMNYREEMRTFVEEISLYANQKKNGFVITPQNGNELLTENGEANDGLSQKYISSINGIGREDLFYGYNNDKEATPVSITNKMLSYMEVAKNNGLIVLVTDYCLYKDKIDDSYNQNRSRGYISFAADYRDLDNIPAYPLTPYNENANDIVSLNDAQNFLYLINPDSNYSSKSDFIDAFEYFEN